MRAASWLREGRRPPEEDRSGFGRSEPGCVVAADGFALMAGSRIVAAAQKGPSGASSLSKSVTLHWFHSSTDSLRRNHLYAFTTGHSPPIHPSIHYGLSHYVPPSRVLTWEQLMPSFIHAFWQGADVTSSESTLRSHSPKRDNSLYRLHQGSYGTRIIY